MVADLTQRTMAACEEYGVQTLLVTGGVVANSALRTSLEQRGPHGGVRVHFPSRVMSTDNAAMIAAAAYSKWISREFAGLDVSATGKPGVALTSVHRSAVWIASGRLTEGGCQRTAELRLYIDVFEYHGGGSARQIIALAGAAACRQHQNGSIRKNCKLPDSGDQFSPSHAWHGEIGNDDVRDKIVQYLQRLNSIRRRLHDKAALFKEAADTMAYQHGIIDDQGRFSEWRVEWT